MAKSGDTLKCTTSRYIVRCHTDPLKFPKRHYCHQTQAFCRMHLHELRSRSLQWIGRSIAARFSSSWAEDETVRSPLSQVATVHHVRKICYVGKPGSWRWKWFVVLSGWCFREVQLVNYLERTDTRPSRKHPYTYPYRVKDQEFRGLSTPVR